MLFLDARLLTTILNLEPHSDTNLDINQAALLMCPKLAMTATDAAGEDASPTINLKQDY